MTLVDNEPAAVQSIEISQLTDGFKQTPVGDFAGSVPTRLIGLWHEDPVLGETWGTSEPDNPFNFPGFEYVTDRVLETFRAEANEVPD